MISVKETPLIIDTFIRSTKADRVAIISINAGVRPKAKVRLDEYGRRSDFMGKPSALKHDDIAHLLGDVDDETIAAILATGGTYADLEIAYACVMGNDREEGQLGPLTGAAARIYDILQDEPAFAPTNEH